MRKIVKTDNFYFIKDFFLYDDFYQHLIFDTFLKRGSKGVPKRIYEQKNPRNLWKNFLGKVKKFQVGLDWRFYEKNRKTVKGRFFAPPPRPK